MSKRQKKGNAKKTWQTWRWILCILFGLSALSCLAGIKEDLFAGIVMFVCCGAIAFFFCPAAPIYKKKIKATEFSTTQARPNILTQPKPISKPIRYNRKSSVMHFKIDPRSDATIFGLKDYVVLDVETTGLNRQTDRIIEIGIVTIKDGAIAQTFGTLVNPEIPISPSASAVNGIYDKDVADAPTYAMISKTVSDFLVGSVVLAHNASFDLAFVDDLLAVENKVGELQYLDTLSYARRVVSHSRIANHKLGTLTQFFSIPQKSAHRALDDALTTYHVFEACRADLIDQRGKEAQAKKQEKELAEKIRVETYKNSPLFNAAIVFAGEFAVPHSNLIDMAKSVGAIHRNKVTKNTTYLVAEKPLRYISSAYEEHTQKAAEWIAKGYNISVIGEAEYIQLIHDARAHLENNVPNSGTTP